MTGDEAADKIRVERGAEWVRLFKKAHPLWATSLDNLMNSDPDTMLRSLTLINPNVEQIPFAKIYLAELQRRLKNGRS